MIAEGPRLELASTDAPLPTMAPHESDLLEDLMQLEHQEWDAANPDVTVTDIWPRIRSLICAHPVSLEEITGVLHAWRSFIVAELQPMRRLCPYPQALLLGAIDFSLRHVTYTDLVPDVCFEFATQCREADAQQRIGQIPMEQLDRIPRPSYGPRTRQAVIIHLYSGRRRAGDFQEAVETLDWGEGSWKPIVISLDIVIHHCPQTVA